MHCNLPASASRLIHHVCDCLSIIERILSSPEGLLAVLPAEFLELGAIPKKRRSGGASHEAAAGYVNIPLSSTNRSKDSRYSCSSTWKQGMGRKRAINMALSMHAVLTTFSTCWVKPLCRRMTSRHGMISHLLLQDACWGRFPAGPNPER